MSVTDYKTSGQRLLLLRRLCGRTRSQIAQMYGIPEISLRQLEHDKYNLTEKTARRCYEAYRQEGLHFTLDWLHSGLGLDPVFATHIGRSVVTALTVQEEAQALNTLLEDELIQVQEAYAFQKRHPHSAVLLITTDEMAPFYAPGDYVGGVLLDFAHPEARQACLGRDCIIELESKVQILRRLVAAENLEVFHLMAMNPSTKAKEPVHYNKVVLRAAPVIWHRRPQPKIETAVIETLHTPHKRALKS